MYYLIAAAIHLSELQATQSFGYRIIDGRTERGQTYMTPTPRPTLKIGGGIKMIK